MQVLNNKKENPDKKIEIERYDNSALKLDAHNNPVNKNTIHGSGNIKKWLSEPYLVYESLIKKLLNENSKVLEIGSGLGLHTGSLLGTAANVTATDVSMHALNSLRRTYLEFKNLEIKYADMEELPFEDGQFDLVACAGSLSYADPQLLKQQILRVLKPGGFFICVDSLNNNPIYFINRYIAYIKSNRTYSTIRRMPTVKSLTIFQNGFYTMHLSFYGAISWLFPLVGSIVNPEICYRFSNYIDRLISVKYSAYKFVLLLKKIK